MQPLFKMQPMNKFVFSVLILVCSLFCFFQKTNAQTVDTGFSFEGVTLDEFVVLAQKDGFDVAGFIKLIKEDTTFYKAFKLMRLQTFNADNSITCFNKNGEKVASLNSETKQNFNEGCRTMRVLEETTTGDFYDKKKNYNYFTAEMYAALFFTNGKVCNETEIVEGSLTSNLSGLSRIEKSKLQLKQLLFNPGVRIPGLPFIGNKVGIFEEDVAKMYDFSISMEQKNGIEAYKFSAIPKSEYRNKVVINKFVTWARISDLSIIARDYSLSYNALGYDFDVSMYVTLAQVGKRLLPTFISYRGNWKVITKSRERVNFQAHFYY